MGTENNNLDGLKDKQPFRVPDGYFEGLTEDIMSRLPEHSVVKSKKISMYERSKPLLYLAAMFIGAIVLMNILNKTGQTSQTGDGDMATTTTLASSSNVMSEDDEFLEYIEEMYADKYAISYIDDYIDSW